MKNLPKKAFKLLLTIFILGNISTNIAQETEREEEVLDEIIDELLYDEDEFLSDVLKSLREKHYIYTSASFNSNTYFSGRSFTDDQFNIAPQISFFHKKGFSLSVSGIYYEKLDPNWDVTNIAIGYSNTIGKNKLLHYNGGYTRYIYSDGWDIFVNSIDAGIGLRNKKRTLGSKLAVSYLFGKDNSLQIVSRTYANINLIKKKKHALKLSPQISLIAAEQTIDLRQLSVNIDAVQTTFEDYFGLLNTQLKLPVRFETSNLDIEASYTINIPNPVPQETGLKTTSFFSISFGYLFGI